MLFWYPQQSMCKIVCDFTSILLNCSMQGMTIVLLEKYFKYIQNGENAKCLKLNGKHMCYHAQFTCSFTCSSKPNEKSQIYCYENSHSCFVNNVISSFHIINLKTVIVQQMPINYSSKLLNSHFAKIMSRVKKPLRRLKYM